MTACTKLDPHEGFCRTCGRETAMLHGKVEHKRGRHPTGYSAPKVSTYTPHRTPLCPDCDARCQLVGNGYWRCPWTTSRRGRWDGDVRACNLPRRAA